MLLIGVTGGIACGKSEVGRILETFEFSVCDADALAHRLMEPGQPVYAKLEVLFGTEIFSKAGFVDREKLGKMVFDRPDLLAKLNQLVHPAVRTALVEWGNLQRDSCAHAAALVPLLFESRMDDLWDTIVCVSSREDLMVERLKSRGLSEEDALKRIASQLPLTEKEARSEWVIENNGSIQELEDSVRSLIYKLVRKGRI